MSSSIRTRKRADTNTLLGLHANSGSMPEPPKPKDNIEQYTKDHILDGLRYAHAILENPLRKLSPMGERGLLFYKGACKRLLVLEDEEEEGDLDEADVERLKDARIEYTSIMRSYERARQYLKCLVTTNSTTAAEMEETLLEMQELLFYARYGDIFADVCNQLKTKAEAAKVPLWRTLQKTLWTDIAIKLDSEKYAYWKYTRGECSFEKAPTHLAISQACPGIGFDMNDTITMIKCYARRNELMHSNLDEMIKEGRFHDLADILFKDFNNVLKVIPASEKGKADLLQLTIRTLIEIWYDVEDIQQPQTWNATKALFDRRKELLDKSNVQQKKIGQDVMTALKERAKKASEIL